MTRGWRRDFNTGLPLVVLLAGQISLQPDDGDRQANVLPEHPGGPGRPHGDAGPEGRGWEGPAGPGAAQGGHGGQRDGGQPPPESPLSLLLCPDLKIGPRSQVSRSTGCGSCHGDEYCGFSAGHALCQKCTVCPPGFFMVAQCSAHADRICQVSASAGNAGTTSRPAASWLQDRDECLEIPDLCRHRQKCLNAPGETPAAIAILGRVFSRNSPRRC